MDKNKENTLHTNEHYSVILMLEDERERLVGGENYKVVHNVHGTVEKYSQCYPEALGAAEYFNDILINRAYLCNKRDPSEVLSSWFSADENAGSKVN